MKTIFEIVNSKFRENITELLKPYAGIRCLSPSFDEDWEKNGEIEKAVLLFKEWALQRSIPGLSAFISRLPGRTPALIIDIPGSRSQANPVLIYGHLDKQPAIDPWSADKDPFEAKLVGDNLYCRGCVDDGYAIVAALSGIEALVETNTNYPHCVAIIEASEESGSPDLDAHLDALSNIFTDISMVLCLDSGGLDFGRIWLTSSLRGIIVFQIDVEVLEHGVHSGSAGGVVPSSFMILRELLARLEDSKTGTVIVDGLTVDIPEFFCQHAVELDKVLGDPLRSLFPTVENATLLAKSGPELILNQTWRPALEVVGIGGIPDVVHGGNVLRSATKAKLSMRLPPSLDPQRASEIISALMTTDVPFSAKVTISFEAFAQGWVAPNLSASVKNAVDQASLSTYGTLSMFCGEGGSIPFLATLGTRFPSAQIIATGALGPGSNAHGPDESLNIKAGVGVAVTVAQVISSLSDSDDSNN